MGARFVYTMLPSIAPFTERALSTNMTAQELRHKLYTEYTANAFPKTLEVDKETYDNALDAILQNRLQDEWLESGFIVIYIGPNKGIMFKGVELILKNSEIKNDSKS